MAGASDREGLERGRVAGVKREDIVRMESPIEGVTVTVKSARGAFTAERCKLLLHKKAGAVETATLILSGQDSRDNVIIVLRP